jgi:hypothetical protein
MRWQSIVIASFLGLRGDVSLRKKANGEGARMRAGAAVALCPAGHLRECLAESVAALERACLR